jgi:uncharacterized protein DUF4388
MTLRGNVQDFPLRSVVDLLGQTKKTGELQVRAGDSVGALGIADGRVVTAVFGEEEPLLALGAIFAIEGAEFEFTPWDDAPPANLDAGTLNELLGKADQAKKRADEARRKAEEEREAARKKAEEEAEAERKRIEELRTLIPTDDVPFRLSERAVDKGPVTLTAQEWRLVLAVNGERDLNAIAAMLHLDNIAALTALAELVRDGVIETAPAVYEAPAPSAPAYGGPPAASAPAYEAPEYDLSTPSTHAYAPDAPTVESEPPAFEAATPTFETPTNAWAPASETAPDYTPEPAAEVPPPPQDWITPDQAVPTEDWAATPADAPPPPTSEVIPGWHTAPAAPAAEPEWIKPQEAEPAPALDDRLSALSGIFGPAPSEPAEPPPAESPKNSWAPPAAGSDHWGTPPEPIPSAERWTKPPAPEAAAPNTSDDPWGSSPASTPTQRAWSPPPSEPAQAPEKDAWIPPAAPPAPSTWAAPAATSSTAADPWGTPARPDSRAASFRVPEPSTPAVEEWSPPSAAPPEKKKRGLFGFGREKPAPPPVAGRPLPTAGVTGSRLGMIAALANTLIAEYNNGQYGKNRVEERIANLLMRVNEQADPIDRPLPIVDDRIDVEALEREQLAESQALPYLALLVTTIFADAEKAFGKDKAKKGYKAAQKSVLLGDASVLSSPELAGKLPRV